jgi:hypothetical protein
VFKRIALSCFVLTLLMGGLIGSVQAQSGPVPDSQQQPPQGQRAAGPPDDLRVNLMIRNAVIALNQANLTGNYSVLRDMGTPNFQMTNSSAKLAEAFSALRTRKLDLSPIMFFNPKLISPPALQDGQLLRLTGFFPTTPEQVSFDLAFQLSGEQWMLAGIAVSTESSQASASPAGQPAHTSADASTPGKPGEAKPIRIDLSQPTPPPAQPAAPKKGTAVKKPKPRAQQTAAAQSPAPGAAPADQPTQPPAQQSEKSAEKPAPKSSDTGSSWNPFAR